MIPKQIIYPIDYSRGLLGHDSAKSECDRFCAAIGGILGSGIKVLPLGRARMGLYLLAKFAINSGRKKVILSPYTVPDVINMVVLAGGEPVFVDCVPRSTNIDVSQLAQLLGDDVACVLLTHYHVNQNDFESIKAMCGANGVLLFEDCAISLSGTINGGHVGSESDGAILSLSGFKFLNYYWGGCVFSRHASMMDALRLETKEWRRLSRWDYFPQMLKTMQYDLASRNPVFSWVVFPLLKRRQRRSMEAVNLNPPRIESAAIDRTLASLPSATALSEWNGKIASVGGYLAHRRRIASIYDQYLLEYVVAPETTQAIREGSCFVNYPVYVGEKLRNSVYKALMFDGYDVGASLYPNCHQHMKFKDVAGGSDNVRDLVRSVVTLPTHLKVDDEYAHRIGRAVSKKLAEAAVS